MADNLPNAVDPVPKFNLITQDYVPDDAVVAEVVAEATKKVSRVVTRGSKKVSHFLKFLMVLASTSPETMIPSRIRVRTTMTSLLCPQRREGSRVRGFLLRIKR